MSVHDVIVVGGGFCGVTAARELALRGRSVLLIEARTRLGGRTWAAEWRGQRIEYGGQWVHWHQPHTWSEITRAGLTVELGIDADEAAWFVGGERRTGTLAERDEIVRRGWDRFVAGGEELLPIPHRPLLARERLAELDRLTIAERLEQLDLQPDEVDVMRGELESLASGFVDDAGAVSVLRWHALSGGSLALTQETGGHVSLREGTGALLAAIEGAARFETLLDSPVAAVSQHDGGVTVETREGVQHAAGAAIVAVPLNVLGRIEFTPALSEHKRAGIALGQASRGVKLMVHARGARPTVNAVKAGHPFGHLSSQVLLDDGSQLLIGFGRDAAACDASDLAAVQRGVDELAPGLEVLDATAHDWLADESSAGTWAIHRPGWYTHHHAAMQRPEGRVVLAGSDLADGWAGFIDGAIESGLRAAREVLPLLVS
jgi:monoamine oxidase